MTEQEQPRRRGRPPKYAGEGKRQNFSFRIRDKVRDQLIETVKETGRSLSEEIEWRIEQSFAEQDLLNRYFGSDEAVELLKMLSSIINYQLIRSGKSWRNDRATRKAILDQIKGLFIALDDEAGHAAREAAYAAYLDHLDNAWKTPSTQLSGLVVSAADELQGALQRADEAEAEAKAKSAKTKAKR